MEQVKHKIPEPLNEFREVFGTITYDRGEWYRTLLRSADIDPDSRDRNTTFTGWVRVGWDRTGIQVRGFRKRNTFRLCSVSQVVGFVAHDPKGVK